LTNLAASGSNDALNSLDSITLTPRGSLIFPDRPGDWREIIFDMAARRELEGDQVTRFWRRIGESFLFSLCRLPSSQPVSALSWPSGRLTRGWVEGAPPMRGGEYLSEELIQTVWRKMTEWVEVKAAGAGDLAKFLAERAPLWQTVARLAFHLAENRNNPQRPFAFMISYVTGLSEAGGERHQPIYQALKQYVGEKDKSTLARLLGPVSQAAEKLKWVRTMVEDNSIYQPMSLTIAQAHQFLMDVPVLEECGLMVRIPNWWRRRSPVQVKLTLGEETAPMFGLTSLVDWNVTMSVGDENLTVEEIQELLASKEQLVFFKGQWLAADHQKLREALEYWSQARAQNKDGLSFIEAMRLLAGYPAATGGQQELEDREDSGQWVHAEAGRALSELLREIRQPKATLIPPELKAVLRPYQEKGLAWLSLLSGLGLGACLADDMGLGKTMQVLALLLLDRERNEKRKPSLLVAPASLLANWRQEAERFAPDLRLSIFHHSETPKEKLAFWERQPKFLLDSDLVVTSYALLGRKIDFFSEHDWRMVIIDEAQAIKNPATAQSRAVRKIKAHARLALTGTPIENRLLDIWALFDYLNPGLLGSARKFKSVIDHLEKRSQDQYRPVRRLISPYLLRRLKTDKNIISDLPDKTETTVHCWLSLAQAKIYNQIVERLKKSLLDFSMDNEDQFRRRGLVLQCLIQLKQLCNHPAQLTGDMDWSSERSGKFTRLIELTKEMAERQDKVLVFTQFQEIIEPLGRCLQEVFGRPGLFLHGGTPVRQRQGLVAEFQKDNGPPFFILSLKAGGTGLNLTEAGHVIHFDRWWNPAVEDQATDRAYRIGQKKNVLVHKCVTRGTLEERIDQMLREKKNLADEVLGQEGEVNIVNMDDQALLDLISLDLERAVI
jgi:non-specific serine/threonine protein kinase